MHWFLLISDGLMNTLKFNRLFDLTMLWLPSNCSIVNFIAHWHEPCDCCNKCHSDAVCFFFFFSVHKLDALLTSRLETDSSAHLDERSKQQHVRSNSWLDLQSPKGFTVIFFFKQHATYILHTLSTKEACLYAGADWLSRLSVRGWRDVNWFWVLR